MAKITLDTITSGFQSTSQVNNNNTDIASNLNDDVLYRNNPLGEPNEMLNLLDMNSNRIINLPAPIDATDPVRLQDVNLSIIVDDVPLVVPQIETIILTSGQRVVTFVLFNTTAASFVVNSEDVDRGRLLSGVDYVVLDSTTIQLTGSYPEGTSVSLLRNEVIGDLPGGGIVTADLVTYNNVVSGLTAVNVQDALDEVVVLIGAGGPAITEQEVLIDGQLIVIFSTIDTALATFQLIGNDVDSREMALTLDYTITNPTTITLTSSNPDGTIVKATQ